MHQTHFKEDFKEKKEERIFQCEWCQNKATIYFESRKKKRQGLLPTGLKYYACSNHMRQLVDLMKPFNADEIKEVKYGK